jgi:hypothetical protein
VIIVFFGFSSESLLDTVIDDIAEEKKCASSLSNSAIDFVICDTVPLPVILASNDLQSLQLAKSLLKYQQHSWKHTKTCFKQTARTPRGDICRFFKPEQLADISEFVDRYVFNLERKTGHEYINTYSILLAQLFRCNHDIKFLKGAQAFGNVYYAVKYSTKAQKLFENYVLLHMNAFKRAESADSRKSIEGVSDASESFSPLQSNAISGRKKIMRMVSNLSSPLEIGAPMACLYLINQSPFYYSHNFVKLYFNQALKVLEKESPVPVFAIMTDSDQSDEISSSTTSCLNPQIIDYLYRDPELEFYCYYDFVRSFTKKKSLGGFPFLCPILMQMNCLIHKNYFFIK